MPKQTDKEDQGIQKQNLANLNLPKKVTATTPAEQPGYAGRQNPNRKVPAAPVGGKVGFVPNVPVMPAAVTPTYQPSAPTPVAPPPAPPQMPTAMMPNVSAGQAERNQGPPTGNTPYFSMTGGINPGAGGNPGAQADVNGQNYHGNPIANLVGMVPGVTTYDQAAKMVADMTPQKPVMPTGPGKGPGSPPGGGGGGHGGGGAPPPTAPVTVPTDVGSQIASLSKQQGGRIFQMDQNLRNILASLGRNQQFGDLLQRLGFMPLGQINADGFYNDWIIPTAFDGNQYAAFLATLDPANQIALSMMISQLFGVAAPGPAVPPTMPPAPGNPDLSTTPAIGAPPGPLPAVPKPFTG